MSNQIDLNHYRVACVQMDIIPGQVEQNCRHAANLAREAIARHARLIVFPELVDLDMVENARDLASTAPGPFTQPLETLAKEFGVHIVIGMSRLEGGGLYNSAVVIGPAGILGAYDKVHVWSGDWDKDGNDWAEDPRRIEPHNYMPGKKFKVFNIDGISVGAIICYDGQFPESWLCNRLLGADLLAWPTNRGSYEDMDIPALARFFQLNVMAANRFGQSSYWTAGDSQIVTAQGKVLAHVLNGESVLVADLDILASRKWRRNLPFLRDRRPDIYEEYLHLIPESEIASGIPSHQVIPLWQREK
jgi:N-carbamoylputrescine amidase